MFFQTGCSRPDKPSGALHFGKPLIFFAMRWLMIGLLVSLGALLLAAAGVARHIWLRRSQRSSEPVVSASQPNDPNLDPADETDQQR